MRKYRQGNRKSEILKEFADYKEEPGFQKRKKKKNVPKGAIYCSSYQTLPERIRWLRARSKPYMTQSQLAERAGLTQIQISDVENCDTTTINMELNTLRRIAHALGCSIFINIKSRPSPISKECQPLGHTLPPLPKWSGKMTEKDRKLAARFGNYPWKKNPPKKYRTSHARTFGTPSSAEASEEPTE